MQPKTDWDAKYLREIPFMAFGSMCNAYGQVFHGKGETKEIFFEGFVKDMRKMFALANEFTQENFDTVEKVKEEGMPVYDTDKVNQECSL